jgi:hypothetical protein
VAAEELPASLMAAEVLVVTQKPETCGLLWPSKLALVGSLPRQILWVGPTDSAIARDLALIAGAGVFAPGDAEGVAKWLTENGLKKVRVALEPEWLREVGIREWVGIVTGSEEF